MSAGSQSKQTSRGRRSASADAARAAQIARDRAMTARARVLAALRLGEFCRRLVAKRVRP